MSEEWATPRWMYRDKRPPNDIAYFENLIRCIFQAGLSWNIVTDKWHDFEKAFDGFSISKVANYFEEDVNRLLADKNIIRNRRKILATIHNAKELQKIAKNHGSFQKWLDDLDKSDNYAKVKKQLIKRFKHVGDSTAHIFLYAVGEGIKWDEHRHHVRTS